MNLSVACGNSRCGIIERFAIFWKGSPRHNFEGLRLSLKSLQDTNPLLHLFNLRAPLGDLGEEPGRVHAAFRCKDSLCPDYPFTRHLRTDGGRDPSPRAHPSVTGVHILNGVPAFIPEVDVPFILKCLSRPIPLHSSSLACTGAPVHQRRRPDRSPLPARTRPVDRSSLWRTWPGPWPAARP